ncbi:hypothetical protein BS47DRAFT_1335153 [Hydnum rufescens UP504]|uniref:Uncharacterized protein n=1 Tax=Hydnum rufescens UP504 TaxID=1448309 RepID=A0A9P6BBJ9_9AGAM|nr:hypothetical protein BS47DRAFT_1335153 [Hydnum rufescens UP504]
MTSDGAVEAFVTVADEITASFSSVRQLIQSTLKKARDTSDLDVKDGISLLSLKNDVLLSYLQSLVLLSSHRILGHSLLERSAPLASFSSATREPRGADAGDLVDSAVESRAILEKTKALEARMRYQIQKLVRVAEDTDTRDQDITHDPLAFRPNLQNLVGSTEDGNKDVPDEANDSGSRDGIYRPPKLAPVPYSETAPSKSKKRAPPVPTALASLTHLDPSAPHAESTSGLGGGSAATKSVVKARLDRMVQFEEDNMTRLLLNKKDAKRRLRDESDIALGGMGGGLSRGGGFEDEFDDVLRAVNRTKSTRTGDGYEELRQRSKKMDVLSRSRTRKEPEDEGKRGRFEKEVRNSKRKARGRR